MKKIMFNDKYELTEAVLSGRKTQTRRMIPDEVFSMNLKIHHRDNTLFLENGLWGAVDIRKSKYARYQVGEVVAIAQNYKDAGFDPDMLQTAYVKGHGYADIEISKLPGWKNKMFTYPTMMPHRIRITDVRVERLQDISDEDCIKEGVFIDGGNDAYEPHYFYDYPNNRGDGFDTPREAYAALIDKISGKGTWESNPFVWVYEFELVN